mmetsp:Transcript_66657/g.146103  ORF Transcript_66657/g.146103 Transcript_66657/m.146103 type:complete len:206 (+) Transcript_66657:772-1389(+)
MAGGLPGVGGHGADFGWSSVDVRTSERPLERSSWPLAGDPGSPLPAVPGAPALPLLQRAAVDDGWPSNGHRDQRADLHAVSEGLAAASGRQLSRPWQRGADRVAGGYGLDGEYRSRGAFDDSKPGAVNSSPVYGLCTSASAGAAPAIFWTFGSHSSSSRRFDCWSLGEVCHRQPDGLPTLASGATSVSERGIERDEGTDHERQAK